MLCLLLLLLLLLHTQLQVRRVGEQMHCQLRLDIGVHQVKLELHLAAGMGHPFCGGCDCQIGVLRGQGPCCACCVC